MTAPRKTTEAAASGSTVSAALHSGGVDSINHQQETSAAATANTASTRPANRRYATASTSASTANASARWKPSSFSIIASPSSSSPWLKFTAAATGTPRRPMMPMASRTIAMAPATAQYRPSPCRAIQTTLNSRKNNPLLAPANHARARSPSAGEPSRQMPATANINHAGGRNHTAAATSPPRPAAPSTCHNKNAMCMPSIATQPGPDHPRRVRKNTPIVASDAFDTHASQPSGCTIVVYDASSMPIIAVTRDCRSHETTPIAAAASISRPPAGTIPSITRSRST